MIKTIYKCDRCGAESILKDQMWSIGLKIVPIESKLEFSFWDLARQPIWCRPCVDELQLLGFPVVKPSATPPRVVTLEEKLRDLIAEIATEEVENAIDNR